MKKPAQNWFFLRGLVRESGHWAGFLEKFEAAFPDRKAIPLDIPGNGLRFREASPVSIGAYAEAMRKEFLTKKGEENFLFAISLGAMVGIEWMNRYPNDFSGAVLGNTSLRGLSPIHHRLQPANYGRILKLMMGKDFHVRERTILEMTSHRKDRIAELESEWVEIQKRRPVSVRNALRQLLAAVRFHPPKAKPSAPILLLNGGQDELVSPACSSALARHWQAPLRVHPSAGHDLTLDEPEWVIEQLRSPFASL